MATYYADPTTDQKADWTEVPTGSAWARLDDAVRSPSTPTTSDDYVESSTNGNLSRHICGTVTPAIAHATEEVWRVRMHAYTELVSASHNLNLAVFLFAESGGVVLSGGSVTVTGPLTGWASSDWLERLLTVAEVGGLALQVQLGETAAEAGVSKVFAAYLELETKARPTSYLVKRSHALRHA